MRLIRNRLGLDCAAGGPLFVLVLLLAAGALLLGWDPRVRSASDPSMVQNSVTAPLVSASRSSQPGKIDNTYGHTPLIFEANRGQSDARVDFLAHGSGYGIFLTNAEAVLALQSEAKHQASQILRMQLRGSRTARATGRNELPGKSNYFIGKNPKNWHRDIPQFAQVHYESVYPGIDLVYYGKQGHLEYDFEVAPAADPGQIALHFRGAENLALDSKGNLLLKTYQGDVRFDAPRVYQRVNGHETVIAGSFALRGRNEVGFKIGPYDHSRALIIDPVLSYSTYLGGSDTETAPAIAVDSGGNAYITGTTTSSDFPVSGSTSLSGNSDAFVTKLNSQGSGVVFSAYLGGTGDDSGVAITVDSGFNAIVAGNTSSASLGTINGFQTAPVGAGNHAFLFRLNSSGVLNYGTYISGGGTEIATGVAVDTKNKVYVTGTTTSTNFPTTTGAFQTTAVGPVQFFLTKLDPTTTSTASLVYSSYFGGGVASTATPVALGGGVAVDTNNNAYITGTTNYQHNGSNPSLDFPILNAYRGCLDQPASTTACVPTVTATDAFVAKINTAGAVGAQLQYSTYVGGNGVDMGTGIAIDSSGNAYVTGSTNSTDITPPTATTTFQFCLNDPVSASGCSSTGAPTDAFVAKLSNPSSGAVSQTYFSFIGGTGNDAGLAIAVDSAQDAFVTGTTASTNFHTTTTPSPIQGISGGGLDAFITRVNTTATGHFSTYLGGSGDDAGTGIAVDVQGNPYVTGTTASGNFSTLNPLRASLTGPNDAFVTKLGASLDLDIDADVSPKPTVGVGNQVSFKYTITNNGDLATGVRLTDEVTASGATFVSANSSPGSCGSATGTPSTVTCSVGTLNTDATATVTVILTPTTAGNALGNSARVDVPGSNFSRSASISSFVSDFSIDASPAAQTTPAGTPVSYQVTVNATSFPNSVSLSCSSGLPTGASCEFTNNPISNLNNGAQTRTLTLNTTVRTTTTSDLLRNPKSFWAAFLPISGLAFVGLGMGTRLTRKRRIALALLLSGFLGLLFFQAGCGSSKKDTTTTTGTPAGTYTITVTGTSGSASRTKTINLVVQ